MDCNTELTDAHVQSLHGSSAARDYRHVTNARLAIRTFAAFREQALALLTQSL